MGRVIACLWFTLLAGAVSQCGGALSLNDFRMRLLGQLAASSNEAVLEEQLQSALERVRLRSALANDVTRVSPVTAVIGGGLAGLTAALRLLEQGGRVLLIEKNSFLGGNSAKASSGINGAPTPQQRAANIDDDADRFYVDTMRSAARPEGSFTAQLARRMADDSAWAVQWIEGRAGVQLTEVGQLGGHSIARTHRPLKGLTGAAFISGLERAVGTYVGGNLTMLKGVRLTGMEPLEEGWELHLKRNNGELLSARVAAVLLATGGFASDKTATSLLREVDPTLLAYSSTNGDHATGDGIKIARELGAKTVDMDMVQVHPTGFTDVPHGFQDTGAERPLILCAEIVRGAGSVVLEKSGKRVWDELDTRRAVTNALHATKQPTFVIAVPPHAAKQLDAHIEIYKAKGLLQRVNGSEGVAEFVRTRLSGTAEYITDTFTSVTSGTSEIPRRTPTQLPLDGEYYVGVMQPVLHYTMGGLAVSPDGRVLDNNDMPITGLFAAGEIMGAVHGENRLGGSSLLDCVVFGLAAADSALARAKAVEDAQVARQDRRLVAVEEGEEPVREAEGELVRVVVSGGKMEMGEGQPALVRIGDSTYDLSKFVHPGPPLNIVNGGDLTKSFIEAHGDFNMLNRPDIIKSKPLRVRVGENYYDFTRFAQLHPGGALSVFDGEDLTERFAQAHGSDMALLERSDIARLSSAPVLSEPPVEEIPPYVAYGTEGGGWREHLGRRSWFLIHSIGAKYPEHPTEDDKHAILNFIAGLGQFYPCKNCRKHLQQQLRDPSLGPPRVDTRQNLTTWLCELHNIVNVDLKKPRFNCDPFFLDMIYLKDCGECEHVPKDAPKKEDAGDHPLLAHGGPWDMRLYASDPKLLCSVGMESERWETRELSQAVTALRHLHSVYGILKESQLSAFDMDMRTGEQGRRKVRKELEAILEPLLSRFQNEEEEEEDWKEEL